MPVQSFAAFTRRSSLFTLGTAGLATIVPTFGAEAKKKNKNKNTSAKKEKQQCQLDLAVCTAQGASCATQAEECTTFLTAICGSDPECQAVITCCSFFNSCDAAGFLTCLESVER